jgi:hypothetical protein
MFTEAIVRAVPETIDAGITSANLGSPIARRLESSTTVTSGRSRGAVWK